MPRTPRIFASLIQSDFIRDGHGNLEAVILTGDSLQHWFRDLTNDPMWRPAQVVTTGATAPGAIIQSTFGTGDHRNFEVVVPMANGRGGSDLWHWFHENDDPAKPWVRAGLVAADVVGPASMIMSDYSHEGTDNNFEVVVPVRNASGGADLWHYFKDNRDVANPWVPVQVVALDVAGPGCLAQSDQGDAEHGNFEVVVPRRNAAGGLDLVHYYHDNSDVSLPWVQAQVVHPDVAGPGCLIVSDFTHDGKDNNFEVVVPIAKGNGYELRHVFHDNSNLAGPWQRGRMVTDSCSGWAALIQGDFGGGDHGNFEVLVEECTSSVVAYTHVNADPGLPWFRHRVVIGEPAPRKLKAPDRICQVTGQYDRTHWDGVGTPPAATNVTEDLYGIRGTDLGSSFEHRDRTWFLFGDTWRTTGDFPTNLDALAFSTTRPSPHGLRLEFLPRPPVVRDPGIAQDALNVPLDGVSDGERMHVFFSTDYVEPEGFPLMGRSVLARSDDGMDFEHRWEFSSDRFVNVSVARGRIESGMTAELGWGRGVTDVLWIWGSGRYRASDVYLAVVPFAALAQESPEHRRPIWTRFFSGRHGAPAWSPVEEDATALFFNASVGELCVRWNPHLSRWLATFNSDNPRGILLHWAEQPWGPWSDAPLQLLDAGDAYGRYMHFSWARGGTDHAFDDVIPDRKGGPENDFGGEYGGYQIGDAAEDVDQGSRIWWLLSTWNPYQVHLMMSHVPRADVSEAALPSNPKERIKLKRRRLPIEPP